MVSKSLRKPKVPVPKKGPAAPVDPITTLDIRLGKSVEQLILELRTGTDEIVRSTAAGVLGHI